MEHLTQLNQQKVIPVRVLRKSGQPCNLQLLQHPRDLLPRVEVVLHPQPELVVLVRDPRLHQD